MSVNISSSDTKLNVSEHCQSTLDQANDATRWVTLGFLICILVSTIILNVSVIYVVNRKVQHKRQTRFLLTSMAVVDLLVGVSIMPFAIYNLVFDDMARQLTRRFCDVFNALDVTFSSMSIFLLTVLTIERYVAICRPFQYHKYCEAKVLGAAYCSAWILLLTLSFWTILTDIDTTGMELSNCTKLEHSGRCHFKISVYFEWISLSISVIIPGILIIFFNVRVARYVKMTSFKSNSIKRMSKPTVDHKKRQKSRQSKHVRAAKTVAILTACFLICWSPFSFLHLTTSITGRRGIPTALFDVTLWLGYVNSAVNPALYLLLQGQLCSRIRISLLNARQTVTVTDATHVG